MSTSSALVMIGLDANGKPHAARFGSGMLEAATEAAGVMRYHLVTVTDPEAVELASGLPEGKLFPTGKAFVPFTARATFNVLAKYVDGDIAPAPKSDTARPRRSQRRAASAATAGRALDVGVVVLAHSDDGAWYEAVITAVAGKGETLKLRWRDYPGEKPFTANVRHVAIAPELD